MEESIFFLHDVSNLSNHHTTFCWIFAVPYSSLLVLYTHCILKACQNKNKNKAMTICRCPRWDLNPQPPTYLFRCLHQVGGVN